MSYIATGVRPIDFSVCHYGTSRIALRGKRVARDRPYWVCLGGALTYGETVVTPFATRLARQFDVGVVNMGIPQSGPDAVLQDPDLMSLITGAQMVVIDPPSVVNQSNPFYTVHPRRNDRFIRALPQLVELYPEADLTDCHFTKHLLSKLMLCDPTRFSPLRDALAQTWRANMRQIVAQTNCALILCPVQTYHDSEIHDLMGVCDADLTALCPHHVRVACVKDPRSGGQSVHNQIFDLIRAKIEGAKILGPSDELALEIPTDASYPQPH